MRKINFLIFIGLEQTSIYTNSSNNFIYLITSLDWIDDNNTSCRPGNIFLEYKGVISVLIKFYNTMYEGEYTFFNVYDAEIISSGVNCPLVEIAGGKEQFTISKGYMPKRFNFQYPSGYEFLFEGELTISGTYFGDGEKRTLNQTIPLEISKNKKSKLIKGK